LRKEKRRDFKNTIIKYRKKDVKVTVIKIAT
jgi:hypothetical protein